MANEIIIEGTVVRVQSTEPLKAIDGTVVTPDSWVIEVRSPDAIVSVYEWINPSGDPDNMIYVPSTGNVYIDLDTTDNAGIWRVIMRAVPVEEGPDETRTKLVMDFIFHVQPLPFLDIE